MEAPSAAQAKRCRSLLAQLLGPIGRDAPEWAGRLIDEFGSLADVLAAEPAAHRRVLPDATAAVKFLGSLRRALLHVLRCEPATGSVLDNTEALAAYLFASMAHAPAEQLRVLFLNSKNRLLRDEVLAEGSISELPIQPRQILMRALEVGAAGLILVHNHPSGDPRPSKGDIQATRRIAEAARALDILVHDHIIVARSGWASFRELGLI